MINDSLIDAQWLDANAELVGMRPKDFAARLTATRRALEAAAAEHRKNKTPGPVKARKSERFIVAQWGWVDYVVHLNSGDVPIEAVGLVQPGVRMIGWHAAKHQEYSAVALLAGGGAGAFGFATVGASWLHLVGLAELGALVVGGAAGAGSQLLLGVRRAIKIERDDFPKSARLTETDRRFGLALHAGASMMEIRAMRLEYRRDMKKAAKQHGLQPIALPVEHDGVENLIHRAIWELVSGGTDESDADILQGIQDLADGVSDDIDTAWESFASFLPAPLPPVAEAIEPETPQAEPTKPAVAMRDAAADLARLREGRRQGAADVRRINEVGHDPEGSQ